MGLVNARPMKLDPTRTGLLRRGLQARVRRGFSRLRSSLWRLLVDEDAFGLGMAANQRWAFRTDPAKVEAFQRWLRAQLASLLVGRTEAELWDRFIEEGLKKGALRSFDEVRKNERLRDELKERPGFYEGSREEFLRSAFAQPVAREKVLLLAGRAFDDLRGVTQAMSDRMSRTLTEGLVRGQSPREIARNLIVPADSYRNRALAIARTEIIRAHAEGQVEALDRLGVKHLGVRVEWSTSGLGVTQLGNESPCPRCKPLEGKVFAIEDSRGLIPLHPN